LTEEEVHDFFHGTSLSVSTQAKFNFGESKSYAAQNAIRMPYNDVFEINEEDISLGNTDSHKIIDNL